MPRYVDNVNVLRHLKNCAARIVHLRKSVFPIAPPGTVEKQVQGASMGDSCVTAWALIKKLLKKLVKYSVDIFSL